VTGYYCCGAWRQGSAQTAVCVDNPFLVSGRRRRGEEEARQHSMVVESDVHSLTRGENRAFCANRAGADLDVRSRAR
jgi:hypothetical protein